jgi:DUF1365 family protein
VTGMHSALYSGSVAHRRLSPRRHRFRYRAFWLLLDLDELPALTQRLRLFSYNRFNLFSLRDADHGDGGERPLRRQIEDLLDEAGVAHRGGRIALFCMPRTLGFDFNPLSVYFCTDAGGRTVAIVYQVHNTFGDRHSYVIRVDAADGTVRQACDKGFYVSPFMDMALHYDFRVTIPADRVVVGIGVSGPEGPVLHASLAGERRALTDRALFASFLSIPLVSLKVIAAIHFEAVKLWLKRFRFYHRPPPPARGATILPKPAAPLD